MLELPMNPTYLKIYPPLPSTFLGGCTLGPISVQVYLICALLVGKTSAIISLGDVFPVITVKIPGTRF